MNRRQHPLNGHVNSTFFHSQQAPCYGCTAPPPAPLGGVPADCQWVLLRDSDEFQALNPGGVGRFAAYQLWRDSLGIWGIRVKPPDCVLAGVSASLGQSSTGFGIIPNRQKRRKRKRRWTRKKRAKMAK